MAVPSETMRGTKANAEKPGWRGAPGLAAGAGRRQSASLSGFEINSWLRTHPGTPPMKPDDPFLSRRRFIQQSTLLSLGAACGLGLPAGRGEETARAIPREGGARLKVSLNAFSFEPQLKDHLAGKPGGRSLLDVLDFAARLDFDAVDPTGYYFPGYPQVPAEKFLNEFKRRAFDLGLDLSGTGVRNDFTSPDPAIRAAGVELVKQWVEAAARLGAPVLRVFAGPEPAAGQSWDEAAKRVADALQPCVEHATRHGVYIGLQNHGDLLKGTEDCLKILRQVKSEWLGLILDTGNFLAADPYADIARAIPFAVNWQIKERLHGKPGAPTDLVRLVRLIRAANYRGYLPIETLSVAGQPYDPAARVTDLVGGLRRALAETA